MYKISNFSKNLLMDDHKSIKSFITNFKGGDGDEDDFSKLLKIIECNKLGIPSEIQNKIDDFINKELAPMVYEHDVVFANAHSVGTIIDGVQHLDTDEEISNMIASFFEVLLEKEALWNSFAESELKPILLEE